MGIWGCRTRMTVSRFRKCEMGIAAPASRDRNDALIYWFAGRVVGDCRALLRRARNDLTFIGIRDGRWGLPRPPASGSQ
jgi:hypothetical protein